MKVAIFTDTFAPDVNGVAKTLKRYKDYLKENDIEYRVFAPKSSSEEIFSGQVHRFLSLPFFLYPQCRVAFPNMLSVKEEIETFKPDVIHVATPFNMGLCGVHYAKKFNIPLVGSYHTDFDKYLEYYDLKFLTEILWKYMRWFHRPFRKIFVPSTVTKEHLQARGFTNLAIWPRGVDCSLFNPHVERQEMRDKYNIKEKYILLYVGRIAVEKDIMLLPKIAEALPEEIKNNVHWLVVGDGPEKQQLEKKAPENMTLTGFLGGEELAKVYATANLFVFPSASETFGNVVLESLACGTPVIGARAGGVKTIVNHDVTGKLCAEKSIADFVDAIVQLIRQPEIREEMGLNGRRYALTQSWDTIFSILLQDYDDVLHELPYQELA